MMIKKTKNVLLINTEEKKLQLFCTFLFHFQKS